jgi:hypothetical protein
MGAYANGDPVPEEYPGARPVNPDHQRIHIAQCRVVHAMTGDRIWQVYANIWEADLVDWAAGD